MVRVAGVGLIVTGTELEKMQPLGAVTVKLNGPLTLFDPATWNCSEVFAGVLPFQENVDQIGVMPDPGLASLSSDTRLPAERTSFIQTRKPASVVIVVVSGIVQLVPLEAP